MADTSYLLTSTFRATDERYPEPVFSLHASAKSARRLLECRYDTDVSLSDLEGDGVELRSGGVGVFCTLTPVPTKEVYALVTTSPSDFDAVYHWYYASMADAGSSKYVHPIRALQGMHTEVTLLEKEDILAEYKKAIARVNKAVEGDRELRARENYYDGGARFVGEQSRPTYSGWLEGHPVCLGKEGGDVEISLVTRWRE